MLLFEDYLFTKLTVKSTYFEYYHYGIYGNLFIGVCALLQVGVKTIVVYVNKADAVNDPEMLELVCINILYTYFNGYPVMSHF